MVSVTLRSLCVEDRPGANDGSDSVDNEVRNWQFHGQVCRRVFGCFSSIDWFGFRDLLGTACVQLNGRASVVPGSAQILGPSSQSGDGGPSFSP